MARGKILVMRVKAFVKHLDYPILVNWWKHWGHPIAPEDELPGTGFMVYWEDKPILCAFLILTNAKFAMMETVCANPETSYEDRQDAIIEVTKAISKVARDLAFRRLIGFPDKERLREKLVEAGWDRSIRTSQLFVKEL